MWEAVATCCCRFSQVPRPMGTARSQIGSIFAWSSDSIVFRFVARPDRDISGHEKRSYPRAVCRALSEPVPSARADSRSEWAKWEARGEQFSSARLSGPPVAIRRPFPRNSNFTAKGREWKQRGAAQYLSQGAREFAVGYRLRSGEVHCPERSAAVIAYWIAAVASASEIQLIHCRPVPTTTPAPILKRGSTRANIPPWRESTMPLRK